jgi:hypothetical protein
MGIGDMLQAERDAEDARRYRWLRKRLEIRDQESMAGTSRPALCTRIGRAFMDSHGPTLSTRSAEHYESESAKLDAAIDAALSDTSEAAK